MLIKDQESRTVFFSLHEMGGFCSSLSCVYSCLVMEGLLYHVTNYHLIEMEIRTIGAEFSAGAEYDLR